MSIDTKISILNANKVNMLTLFALKIDILYFLFYLYIIYFYKSPMTMYLTFVPKHKYQCFGTLIKIKVISDHQVIKVKQIGKPKIGYRDAIPTWF